MKRVAKPKRPIKFGMSFCASARFLEKIQLWKFIEQSKIAKSIAFVLHARVFSGHFVATKQTKSKAPRFELWRK